MRNGKANGNPWNKTAQTAAALAGRERAEVVVESAAAVMALTAHVEQPLFGKVDEATMLYLVLKAFEDERALVAHLVAELETAAGRAREALGGGYSFTSCAAPAFALDVAAGRLQALRDAARGTCRLFRVYCGQLWTERERAARALRLRHEVTASGAGWLLLRDGAQLAGSVIYQTEEAAWLAFDAVTS